MRLAWNRGNNRINQLNHRGITFESVALTFDDPHYQIFRTDRIVSGE